MPVLLRPLGVRAARMSSSGGTVPSSPIPQTASAQPGPNAATHRPAATAPSIWPAFMRQPADRAGLLQHLTGHEPGQQRRRGRVEDRHARAGQAFQQQHLPQRRVAGQYQEPEGALAERDHDVARRRSPAAAGTGPRTCRRPARTSATARSARPARRTGAAVEPVAYSTANDTPTSENPKAAGASSRSASSSRKSRMDRSTGKRRTTARANMTVLPILTRGPDRNAIHPRAGRETHFRLVRGVPGGIEPHRPPRPSQPPLPQRPPPPPAFLTIPP